MTHGGPQWHQYEWRGVGEAGKMKKRRGLFVLLLFLFACLLCFVFFGGGATEVRERYGGPGGKRNQGA